MMVPVILRSSTTDAAIASEPRAPSLMKRLLGCAFCSDASTKGKLLDL